MRHVMGLGLLEVRRIVVIFQKKLDSYLSFLRALWCHLSVAKRAEAPVFTHTHSGSNTKTHGCTAAAPQSEATVGRYNEQSNFHATHTRV